MTTLRLPLVSLPNDTSPSISAMMAWSFGLRASKSSATRGRPPVMSCVFVVSRGILAMTSPASMLVAVLHDDVGADREEVARVERAVRQLERLARLRVLDRDARAEVRGARLDDDLAREAGDLVELLGHRDAFDDVAELHDAGDLGEDRHGEGVPLGEELAGLDLVALLDLEHRAVDEAVVLALAAGVVDDDDLAVAVHDDDVPSCFFATFALRMRT